MPICDQCGASDTLTHNCNYCKNPYCPEHVLPENHTCIALNYTNTLGPEFRTADADKSPNRQASTAILGSNDEKKQTNRADSARTNEKHDSPQYDSSPDVALDGNVVTSDSDEPAALSSKSRLKKLLAGATVGQSYRGDCPFCGEWVSKRKRDRFTECYRCGWKAGVPGLRFFTHWPNWYLWKRRGRRWGRRVSYLAVVATIIVIIISATSGVGVPAIDNTVEEASESAGVGGLLNTTTAAVANLSKSAGSPEAQLNDRTVVDQTKIEQEVHRYINEERTRRGLSRLQHDRELQEIARYHSSDMVKEGYFAHDSPSGETMEERYGKFGYDCRVQMSSTRYASGAENIAYTYAYRTIETNSGRIESYDGNETEIARGLVRSWMNSPGHRENILRPYWESEGIGVIVADVSGETRVYATQNFC